MVVIIDSTHNPFDESHRVSCWGENLTSSFEGGRAGDGLGLDLGTAQFFIRQILFYSGAQTSATEKPRAWTEHAAVCASLHMMSVEHRIG